jgi:hypothetical protein
VSTTVSPDDGFEVVVDDDGNLRVPADELARHGVRPGAHLRLVPEQREGPKRRSARGMFANRVQPGDLDEFEAAMAEAKSERIAAVLADQ